jgi:hypothetical protein
MATVTKDKVIKDNKLMELPGTVKPDSKKRVVLPKCTVTKEAVTYKVYINRCGQIVLDPMVQIPASEAWLYKNPVALKLVEQGLEDIAKGRLVKGKRSDL